MNPQERTETAGSGVSPQQAAAASCYCSRNTLRRCPFLRYGCRGNCTLVFQGLIRVLHKPRVQILQ